LPGPDQLHRLVPTATPGPTTIQATGGGRTMSLTVHVVVSTPLPATNPPAVLRHILLPTPAVPPANAAGITVITIGDQGVTGPEIDLTAHLDGANWKLRVTEIRHRYKVGVAQRRIPVSGPGDPVITPDTIGPIIADLTPPGPGAARGPRRSTYMSLPITRAHEEAHVNRFYSTIWPVKMAQLETEIEAASVAFDPATAATVTAVLSRQSGIWQARANSLHQAADAAEITGAEAATHDVSNPMYTALIASIRDTVAPPAPVGLSATAGSGGVALTWTPGDLVNTTGFVVQRRTGTGPFVDVTVLGPGVRTFTDAAGTAGPVTYRILAVGAAGRSNPSPTRSVTATP